MATCDHRSSSSSPDRIFAKYQWEVGIVKQNLWRFIKDDSGATTIEYGLIAGFISFAIFSALTATGDTVGSFFAILASDLQNVAAGINLWGDR